ncbi:hypothetical protein [Bradyrhizobium neotropicale]|uniref:hypothetical protein n=1 Tax=Bradyrhizobium neotropicale TaxID=1497615 RepID=UPI001AD737B6|nr:hypothetical protein [Bradyrhizobium neotropicale]MBO4228493.1 hypothetical protein [Bradyrhizobium neotropicale]
MKPKITYRATSRDAWRSFLPISRELDRLIMEALSESGDDGLICQEIETRICRSHQAVSGNLRHLVEDGLVRASGQNGKTTAGRRAIKWVVAGPESPSKLELRP